MSEPRIGYVVIGRNEGERLTRCFASLEAAAPVVYVDSGSTDESVNQARIAGATVVELGNHIAFTAARARNAGFEALCKLTDAEFVQFIDGDCQLFPVWTVDAYTFLNVNPQVCAVYGRRRERDIHSSIYNKLCDFEWNVPIGPARSFAGDVMIRAAAFQQVGGYRDDVIAGEEPELSIRLRGAGWKIWRIDSDMTLHDAAISRFSQWWQRNVRSGYAFALGSHLHGRPPERHWVWESRRALLWGLAIPASIVLLMTISPIYAALLAMVYPAQVLRLAIRARGDLLFRFQKSFFETLGRFPETVGQIRFLRDRLFGRIPALIEYK